MVFPGGPAWSPAFRGGRRRCISATRPRCLSNCPPVRSRIRCGFASAQFLTLSPWGARSASDRPRAPLYFYVSDSRFLNIGFVEFMILQPLTDVMPINYGVTPGRITEDCRVECRDSSPNIGSAHACVQARIRDNAYIKHCDTAIYAAICL